MAGFDTYKDLFPHAKLTRSQDGVLEVVLHTDGATLVFNGYAHEEFVELFHQIGQDARNRVVILTGAGEAFIDRMDPEGFDFFSPISSLRRRTRSSRTSRTSPSGSYRATVFIRSGRKSSARSAAAHSCSLSKSSVPRRQKRWASSARSSRVTTSSIGRARSPDASPAFRRSPPAIRAWP